MNHRVWSFCYKVGAFTHSSLERCFYSTRACEGRYALAFPGQGYQQAAMLKELHTKYPTIITPILDEFDQILDKPLSTALIDNSLFIDVNDTSNAQPLILCASYAFLKVAEHLHKPFCEPAYILGHSLGEYTALLCSNVLSFRSAVYLVRQRGLAMIRATRHVSEPQDLSMVAIFIPRANASQISIQINNLVSKYENVSIANYNSSTQMTLSGKVTEINDLISLVKSQSTKSRIRTRRLNVSGPFHSTYMIPAAKKLESLLCETTLDWPPSCNVISNLTADVFQSESQVRHNLVKAMTQPVQWERSLRFLQSRVQKVVSVGPGDIGKLCTGYTFDVNQLL